MADVHDRALIATTGVAIDQEVTATLRSHMAQSHGCELSNFGSSHANKCVPPSAFGQYRRGRDWREMARQVMD
jgi:hypothetical protein